MTKYVLYCGGLQGINYYDNKEEALEAAAVRTYITGARWVVREVYIPRG